MIKLVIRTLSVVLLCNSIATAQYFGIPYPASSSQMQSAQPIRIARAMDTSPTSPLYSASDTLDDRDPLVLTDLPEKLDLPQPADIGQATVPEPARDGQPEISTNDFVVELAPAPVTPLPGPIDFSQAIERQQYDYAQSAQRPIAAQDGVCQDEFAGPCGAGQAAFADRTAILPPPNSFHGHFRSNPCYFDLWANYPAEAAAACAHNRAKLAPTKAVRRTPCESAAPCPGR